MAVRNRAKPTTGWVAAIDQIQLQEGRLTETALSMLVSKVNEIAALLSGRVSKGDGSQGSWAGNIDSQYIEVTFPSAANTEQAIYHSLGRTPVGYNVVRRTAACDIYDSSSGSWSDSVMYLKSSVGNVTVTLEVW